MTLTADHARELFDYDPEDGVLVHRTSRGKGRVGTAAGQLGAGGRIHLHIAGRGYLAHRVIWLMVHGRWPDGELDHVNGDPGDNRLCNLREVTRQQNALNKTRATTRSSTGLLGVNRNGPRTFSARINVGGRRIWLGNYATAEAAHDAYMAYKQAHGMLPYDSNTWTHP